MDDWKPSYLGEPRPYPDKANHPNRSVTREAHAARRGPGLVTQEAAEMRARQPEYEQGLGRGLNAGKLTALRRPGTGFDLGMFR